MKLLRLTGPFLLSALIVSPHTAPSGGNVGADPVIGVDVNLRQVDLIVTDTKGNHVSDLQSGDLQLLEDGKPQNITNFLWVEVTPPPSGARLAAHQEKPSLSNGTAASPAFGKRQGDRLESSKKKQSATEWTDVTVWGQRNKQPLRYT